MASELADGDMLCVTEQSFDAQEHWKHQLVWFLEDESEQTLTQKQVSQIVYLFRKY